MRGRNRLLRRYFRLLCGLTLFLNSGLALALPSQETSRPPFDHVPPSSFVRPEPLVFRALSQADIDWVLCFWKAEGADDFDSLPLEPLSGGVFEGRLATEGITAASLTYYLAFESRGRIYYLPEKIPDDASLVRA
jgi:hypothetical protein